MEQNDRGTYLVNITATCVECIINQSRRVGETLRLSEERVKELVAVTTKMSASFSFHKTPPEVATPVYRELAKIVGKKDLYDEVKRHSTQKALSLLPRLEKELQNAQNPFITALKIAVAGNVIDLASEVSFDLDEELEKIFHTDFAEDDSDSLHNTLQSAKNVVVLGDNAGEHVFDKLFVKTLQKLFPHIEFYYFVRGEPIINDVTYDEAIAIGFEKVCTVIDSGVPTPGFVYDLATNEAKKLFDTADAVISKGMGNYECLTPSHKSPIFFLLKVKCSVVAASLGLEVGDLVCKKI